MAIILRNSNVLILLNNIGVSTTANAEITTMKPITMLDVLDISIIWSSNASSKLLLLDASTRWGSIMIDTSTVTAMPIYIENISPISLPTLVVVVAVFVHTNGLINYFI